MVKLEPGTEVSYRYEGQWRDGVIHGVKSQEEPDGRITKISYLIDTGKDFHVNEFTVDHREQEINRRVNEALKSSKKHPVEILGEVLKHTDLPKSKIEKVVVRQPEQIEVDQSEVKPR